MPGPAVERPSGVRGTSAGVLLLLLLAAPAVAIEVPAGPMPRIDGEVGREEWSGAAELRAHFGTARLRISGRALCIGLEMRVPYRGERIELQVADPRGLDYSWHGFHPACAVPEIESFPVAPVLARHASWSTRDRASFADPRDCLFRSRVYRAAERWIPRFTDGWSAEIAVDRTALDVTPERGIVFLLDVTDPAGRRAPMRFAPQGDPREGPAAWSELKGHWSESAEAFRTPEEDARRTFELEIFREFVDRALGRESRVAHMDRAVGSGRKSNAAVDSLLQRLDGCIQADPDDFFARFCRARLLRRANRLYQADGEVHALAYRLPLLPPDQPPLVAERFALAVSSFRFEAAARYPLPRAAAEHWERQAALWAEERERRRQERSSGTLPRVAFETSKGRIVVELFEDDLPNAVAFLVGQIESGAYEGRPFDEVTGGVDARAKAAQPAEAALLGRETRLPWRGTLALIPAETEGRVRNELHFATGHLHLSRRALAVGDLVEGWDAADALERGDRIESARVLRKRDHAYEVREARR